MTSTKQKKANKENSKKSTGPKSLMGKAKVAMNATKHGIFTSALVIKTGDGKEDLNEYQELYEAIMDDLKPIGQMETLLVEKIVCNYWRQRRILNYESGKILALGYNLKNEAIDNHLNPNLAFLEPEKPTPKPLNVFHYDEDIADEDIKGQMLKVLNLRDEQRELSDIYYVLEHIHYNYEWNGESGEIDKEKAKKILNSWSAEEQKHFRNNLLTTEEDILWEMKEVRHFQAKFERISRICCIPNEDDLIKIQKYETMLERSIFQNLALLKTLQRSRQKLPSGKTKNDD